jgi:hypothetical protein
MRLVELTIILALFRQYQFFKVVRKGMFATILWWLLNWMSLDDSQGYGSA